MIRLALIVFLFAAVQSANAQKISLLKVASTKPAEPLERSGIIYSLPKNLIVVEFGIKKSKTNGTSVPNFCSTYPDMCEKLGINKVFRVKDSLFQISDYKIATRAIPDTEQIYRVKLKKQWNKDFKYTFSVSDQGLLQGADVTITDKTFEVIGQGLGTIISIAAKVLALRPAGSKADSIKKAQDAKESSINKELAELIATKKKLALMTDYTGGDAFKYQIEEINKMIEVLKEEVTGTEKVVSATYRFELEVDCKSNEIVIGKLDKNKGFYSSAFNAYLFYDSRFKNNTDSGKMFKVVLTPIPGFGTIVKDNMIENTDNKQGLAYQVPVPYSVNLYADTNIVASQQIPLPQCGSIAHMPYKLNQASLTYYEELGFIKTVSTEGTSTAATQISKGEELTKSGIDAVKKKDELTKLKEENALLEEKKKNKELKSSVNEQ